MRLFLSLAALAFTLSARAADADGFTPLFNGKNLDGWTTYLKPPTDGGKPADPKDVWSIKDGVIVCTGKPNGYIATAKEYSDYVLRVQWRYPAGATGGNSGVLLHCQPGDRVWPHSVEAQMRAGLAGDIWLNADDKDVLPRVDIPAAQFDTANKQKRHYFRLDRETAVEKPFGEWNAYEITCKGGDFTLSINGRVVNTAKNCSLSRGRIALQSEGAEVHFKDIALKPLK